ncbi:BON domain-containing protein [Cupriavidus necator]|uniref:BON domain-containing protein n=1 Tax=Cupriavidus necator TaxID=106590 RepID=A0A1U9V1S5_CUPNE|nr:BON domain-containing protein [Cupriavidus necator]AQV98900.1 BON domain-containing protein [Cupriavidus necator]
MFNFRNDRGSRSRPEPQRRERAPAQRMRDESRGSGSEDWGQEWGEDWRGERGYGAADIGGAGHPYSGGYGGYRSEERESGYGYRDEGRFGPRGHRAVGPKGYRRSDERVREDVCERLAMNPYVDVGEVSVEVANGVVTLDGTVRERREKYVAEEIADAVFGVTEVDNHLRVQRQPGTAWAAGSEVGGDDSAGASGTASASGTSPDRTLNKS